MKIGITERGDAFHHRGWETMMDSVDAAIIISKGLPKSIANYKSKIIFHATTTGYGGTAVEPNVMPYTQRLGELTSFCELGYFPKEQVVIRVDPIIPTLKGIITAEKVIVIAIANGFTRFRFSFIDLYKHVSDRFTAAGMRIDKSMFNIPAALDMIRKFSNEFVFESCAELNEFQSGCISQDDLDILGIKGVLSGNKGQRSGCLCPSEKTELLNHIGRCPHKCLYCYWK